MPASPCKKPALDKISAQIPLARTLLLTVPLPRQRVGGDAAASERGERLRDALNQAPVISLTPPCFSLWARKTVRRFAGVQQRRNNDEEGDRV